MDHATHAHIYQAIVENLKELGIPNAKFSITDTTALVQDGRCVGRSFVRGHVRVVVRPGCKRIEFHDENGGMIRAIFLPRSIVGWAKAA